MTEELGDFLNVESRLGVSVSNLLHDLREAFCVAEELDPVESVNPVSRRDSDVGYFSVMTTHNPRQLSEMIELGHGIKEAINRVAEALEHRNGEVQ